MLLNLGLHPAVVLPCIGVAAMWEGRGPDFSRPGCKAYFSTCLILCQLLRSMAPDVCDTYSPHPAALWPLLLLSLTWLKPTCGRKATLAAISTLSVRQWCTDAEGGASTSAPEEGMHALHPWSCSAGRRHPADALGINWDS